MISMSARPTWPHVAKLSIALILLVLTGCSSTSGAHVAASNPGSSPKTSPGATISGGADLTVATTPLGQIVVDGKGMTAYFFDKDTANSGASACTGQCQAIWPAITSSSTTPTVSGVTGTVGTIATGDGSNQVTINGRPIYTYAYDTAPGDTNGQGVSGIWYVISPAGDEIKSDKSPTRKGY